VVGLFTREYSTRALSRTNWIYRFQPVFRLSLYGADSNLRFFFRRRRLAFLANASSPFELFPKLFIALLAFTFCTGCIFLLKLYPLLQIWFQATND